MTGQKALTHRTSPGEKISYGLYFFGQNLIYTLVSQFLPLFYTDYILLTPMIASLIFLVSKIWDAVNDPIFGILIDKAPFGKRGKFLPWIRITTIALPVVTFLLFTASPDQHMTTRIIWTLVTYLLWDLLYTVCDAPLFALSTAMTDVAKERSLLVTLGRFTATLGVGVINLVFSAVIEQYGFIMPVLLTMLVCFFFMLPLCWKGKERFSSSADTQSKEKHGLKEIFIYLGKNKYLLFFYLAYILINSLILASTNYVAKYCLGDLKYVGVLTIVQAIPALLPYVFMPYLLKRWDKITLFRISVIMSTVLYVASFFAGYKNITVFMTFVFLRSFATSIPFILGFTFSGDCVEYGEFRSGIRKEGITFSVQTFTAKLSSAFAGTLTLMILSWTRYDGGLSVQSPFTIEWIWNAHNLVPALGCLLSLPLLYAYKLKDRDVQIMTDCNAGKITREEAEACMSRKY